VLIHAVGKKTGQGPRPGQNLNSQGIAAQRNLILIETLTQSQEVCKNARGQRLACAITKQRYTFIVYNIGLCQTANLG
jgi:hypothetical protein